MTDLITSANNPIVKRIRSLADRKARKREGVFLVEGIQPVWRAVESGWGIDTLVIAPQLITNGAVFEMARDLKARGVRIAELSADVFTRLSERDGPAGVMAIVEMQSSGLADLNPGPADCWILLHRVHNPGNLGTIIRTADASGMAGIILTGDSTDAFAPASVKASMGSIFSLPMVIERDTDRVLGRLNETNVRCVGTSGYAEHEHWDADWNGPICIVLGNEGDGLPEDILAQLDSTVRIPMTGTAESLNLSIAAAVLMYEAKRHAIP